MVNTEKIYKIAGLFLIFIGFLLLFFVINLSINAWWPQNTEEWDYTVYHTYTEPVNPGGFIMRICQVVKLYTDSVCTITCPDGTIIELNVDVPNNEAIPARYINISSELQDFNCTYSCKGVFVGYTCGGIPDEK